MIMVIILFSYQGKINIFKYQLNIIFNTFLKFFEKSKTAFNLFPVITLLYE